jgi:fatty-acyl-CoA synthase
LGSPLLIGDILRVTARRVPGRVAATLGKDEVTYAELEASCQQLTRALAAQGIGLGDRVGWWGDTTLDVIPLWFAIARVGGVVVPMNPKATSAEVEQLIDTADPATVVSDDGHDGALTLSRLQADTTTTGITPPVIDENSAHVIFFTSGSTGRPKGVELSHRASWLRVLSGTSSRPSGASICMFPQFHMAAWYGPMSTWASGDEVAYVERADAEVLLDAVHRRRANRLYCIPAVWRRILEFDRTPYDLSCLQMCDTGTSATTPDLLRAIADAFPGTETTIQYGSTEAGSVCQLWPQDVHRKPGSVGLAAAGSEVRLTPEGELVVRNATLMNGYFRNPEATAEALQDGWYHTGDLAVQDDEGYYSIVGRSADVIRTGGETVAPVEVDTVLQQMPGVADAAVAGVPDDDWGQVIVAFVVLQPGAALELEDVRDHCQGKLATFKHPRRLLVVNELPRTGATRQVQRRIMVQWAQEGDRA